MATITEKQAAPYGPRDAGAIMTLDEFDAADFELGYRYELIHGVLIVTPPPLEEERDANEELGRWLRNYQESHAEGKALNLTLPEQNVRTVGQNRRCDRVIWAGLGRRPRSRGPVERRDVPTIVVEFPSSRASDRRREYEEKKSEYRDIGVREYWIIDRFSRLLTVYHRRGERCVKRTIGEVETYHTPLLPGFELPLAKLLTITDQYQYEE
ncbi:MAG TPA: Uma2 family endonuclease [Pirellulales bacterium]